MPSTHETSRGARRKVPADRRREILDAGAAIGLTEGLGKITARRLADAIGVRSGLVMHYFPTVDQLLAEVFSSLTTDGRPEGAMELSPTEYVAGLIHRATATDRDPLALMWLDAWRQAADRPQLRSAVMRQMERDAEDLTEVIGRGALAGDFAVSDPAWTALRILGIVDGQIVASVVRAAAPETSLDYSAVVAFAYESVERELGLPAGTLQRD